MEYRREIDGLRALAVVPVILFHAGFDTFGGGFVGVDVFFVISGYLITNIILSEQEKGKFSIIKFYERRARRILPALFFVMLACLPAAWLLLVPSELKDFSASLIAVSTFSSNFLFWQQSGYFETVGELKPLLHTWSLAVEEQYYVIFPLLAVMLRKINRELIFFALLFIAVISLSFAQWGSSQAPDQNFFLLPARAWELMLGALVAHHCLYRASQAKIVDYSRVTSELLGWTGFSMILYSVVVFDKSVPFPSLYALIPTVGTVLIILFSSPNTSLGKLLGRPSIVMLGLLSYSAYLWHQPIFAFARHYHYVEPGAQTMLALSALSILLAYVSWRFVEKPFRNQNTVGKKSVFLFSLFGIVFFTSIGLAGYSTEGVKLRNPPNIEWVNLGTKTTTVGEICDRSPKSESTAFPACFFGDTQSKHTIALYGDSHASAISYALNAAFKENGIRGLYLRPHYRCHVIPGMVQNKSMRNFQRCMQDHKKVLQLLEKEAESVVVIARWTFSLYPIAGEIEQLAFDNGEGGVESVRHRKYGVMTSDGEIDYSKNAKQTLVTKLMDDLLTRVDKVYLVYPVPELGWDPYKENFRYYQLRGELLQTLSTSTALYRKRNQVIIDLFDDLEKTKGVVAVRSGNIFCDSLIPDRCAGQIETVPLYYDDDHLSNRGSQMLVDALLESISGQQRQIFE